MVEVADGGGGAFPAYSVEIGSLADFIAFIERELNGTLDPAIDRARGDYPRGLEWGTRITGQKIPYARFNYVKSQRLAVENLAQYLLTGVAMLEVIDRLTQVYRTTEELATLTTEDIQGFLSTVYNDKHAAMREAQRPRDANGNYMDL
jgi:hypothetical protein